MKTFGKFLSPGQNGVVLAVFLAGALSARAAINVVAETAAETCNAGVGTTLTATVTGDEAVDVYADFCQGRSKVRVYLEKSGATWTGAFPPGRAGTANYLVVAKAADGSTNNVSGYITYEEDTTTPTGLTNQRYPNIVNWSTATAALDGDWAGYNVSKDTPQMLRLVGSPAATVPAFSGNTAGGFVRTRQPVMDGVGTIWFKAKMANTNRVDGGDLSIERITWISGSGGRAKYNIQEVAEIQVPAATGTYEWHQFHLILQSDNPSQADTDVGYWRIRNKTLVSEATAQNLLDASIDIEDIVLTPLLPDVTISKAELDYSPGYPSVQDPIDFTITVSNCYAAAPATVVTPRLLWRQSEDDEFTETVLTNVLGRTEQGAGVYACTLGRDEIQAGPFEYFYEVSFAGYTPTFPAVKYPIGEGLNNVVNGRFELREVPYLIHTNALALLSDGSGGVNESRSPACYPDFLHEYDRTSVAEYYDYGLCHNEVVPGSAASAFPWGFESRFDLRALDGGWPATDASFMTRPNKDEIVFVPDLIEIPGDYAYLHFLAADGVRRFRSQYDAVGLRVADTDPGSPSGLESGYAMQQVADYTWMAIVHVTNAIDVAVAPTGACRFASAEGGAAPAEYERGPFVWLEHEQAETAINPPSSGTAEQKELLMRVLQNGSATNWYDPPEEGYAPTRVQIDYDGFLMYRFCTTNDVTQENYQIRRAAWQDFNVWQADDTRWSRSYGLYDMTVFESDLESSNARVTDFSRDFSILEGNEKAIPFVEADRSSMTNGNPAYFRFENGWILEEWTTNALSGFLPNRFWRLSAWKGVGDTRGTLETMGGNWSESTRGLGRDTLKFKVRPSVDDGIAVYYDDGGSRSWRGYTVLANVQATSWSDAKYPYASVCVYWKDVRNYAEARLVQKTEYKTVNNKSVARKSLEIEFWKCENGTLSKLAKASGDTVYADNNKDYTLGDGNGWTLGVVMPASGSTVTVLLYSGSEFMNATSSSPAKPKRTVTFNFSSTAVASGTVAFNVYDVAATFRPWVFATDGAGAPTSGNQWAAYPHKATDEAAFGAVCLSAASEWAQVDELAYDHLQPWHADQGSNGASNPTKLYRDAPVAYYRIRVSRTLTASTNRIDVVAPDWTDGWDHVFGHLYDRVYQTDPEKGFAWTDADEVKLHLWDDSYLQIQALEAKDSAHPSTAHLCVDAPHCDNWCGQTVYDPESSDAARNEEESWRGSYAAIRWDDPKAQRGNKSWELAISRANPMGVQTVESPHLWNGIGDFFCTARVKSDSEDQTDRVAYQVQYVDDLTGNSKTILAATNAVSDGKVTVYAAATMRGMSGRIRIKTLGEEDGSSPGGVLCVDDLRATDYPNTGDTSWEAYNVLVSALINPDRRELRFDGRSRSYDSCRTAVLNDSVDGDTFELSLPDHKPYVQTPSIETGVGEIGFWYRAWPDNGDTASLGLYVARTGATPDDQWKKLSAADLNPGDDYDEQAAALAALDHIDPTNGWRYFSCEFYLKDYNLLRLSTETNGTCRVMVDNVIITEPVRSSIDVGSVVFDPAVPLTSADTDVTVTLVNPRKNPHDIHVYLDWYAMRDTPVTLPTNKTTVVLTPKQEPRQFQHQLDSGEWVTATYYVDVVQTNAYTVDSTTRVPPALAENWGYLNWSNRVSGTIALTNNPAEGPYVFHAAEKLPTASRQYPADTVFQYCVRVVYKGDFASPVYSETQGDVRNGFRFENPSWYDPVDLNRIYGTESAPVAHFWLFATDTNVVFVNELRPVRSSGSQLYDVDKQFIELLGPRGASIANWTIHHAGRDDMNTLDINLPSMWTNTLHSAAAFGAVANATTNKGWGVFVIGASGVEEADQDLYEGEEEENAPDTLRFMYVRGALTLKRSMGAWADRVCWANTRESQVQAFLNEGYTLLGLRNQASTAAFAKQGEYNGLTDETELLWKMTTGYTPGGFNQGEEDGLRNLLGEDEEKEVPLIGQPLVTSFSLDEGGLATLVFEVSTTNGVALAKGDYTWYLRSAATLGSRTDDISFDRDDLLEVTPADITAADDGTASSYTVTFPVEDSDESRFYWIVAYPRGE